VISAERYARLRSAEILLLTVAGQNLTHRRGQAYHLAVFAQGETEALAGIERVVKVLIFNE